MKVLPICAVALSLLGMQSSAVAFDESPVFPAGLDGEVQKLLQGRNAKPFTEDVRHTLCDGIQTEGFCEGQLFEFDRGRRQYLYVWVPEEPEHEHYFPVDWLDGVRRFQPPLP